MGIDSQTDGLSGIEEKVLLALWRLRSIGKATIQVETLRADLEAENPSQAWRNAITSLQNQGFLETSFKDGSNFVSLTPLGLSILRQIEENHLEELR